MFSNLDALRGGCYFIGIGGVSMSALARLLHDKGIPVRGSDAQASRFTEILEEEGIKVHIGEAEEITENIVVYTGAVSPDQAQFARAREAGKRFLSRAELLGLAAKDYKRVISVAGCHGKTTTSSMLAHILKEGGRAFACHIGGEDLDFCNYFTTGGDFFVTEACEFRRSFLQLESDVGVILNCDRDHTDCYKTKAELLDAYRDFGAKSKKVVVNADDIAARSIPHTLSFGLKNGDIRAERLKCEGERYSFTVTERGIRTVRISLRVIGKVNILNALAAYAVARLVGFSADEVKAGLERFRGVKRRFEYVGNMCGVPVVCDYAHHPREISATLQTAQRLCEGRVHLVFQPHTYTRTRDLMAGFIEALSEADELILYKTYAAREAYDWEGCAARLASLLPASRYVQTPEQLKNLLSNTLKEGDMLLVLGAGDIYDIIKRML